jgi:pyruvate ferredoxin oxidoreductase alpha subunit
MKKVLEGSQAVAEAVRLAGVGVISAYPITPQTHIVEELSTYCADGTMNAKFLRVESEHSALAALIGAASNGIRTFTATSSQGLALMHELLHWASGARLPIVMAEVNRALAPGWNIWTDQTDSLAQRDTGWIQFYCENSQETLDTTLQAYRLAEMVNLPVMVVLDAFYLSHTYEPVDVPDQKQVDRFLKPYAPKFQADTQNPCAFGPLVLPDSYMEMRYDIARAMDDTLGGFSRVEDEYARIFGRRYGAMEPVMCKDADVILLTSGTVTSTARIVLRDLRKKGEKVGLLKLKMFRPFPVEEVRKVLKGAKKVAVIDRNFSFGASGIFAQELRAALCNLPKHPAVFGYIAGIGGRDVTPALIEDIYWKTKKNKLPDKESIWMGLKEVSDAARR